MHLCNDLKHRSKYANMAEKDKSQGAAIVQSKSRNA